MRAEPVAATRVAHQYVWLDQAKPWLASVHAGKWPDVSFNTKEF
jgi:hypothetical protein